MRESRGKRRGENRRVSLWKAKTQTEEKVDAPFEEVPSSFSFPSTPALLFLLVEREHTSHRAVLAGMGNLSRFPSLSHLAADVVDRRRVGRRRRRRRRHRSSSSSLLSRAGATSEGREGGGEAHGAAAERGG